MDIILRKEASQNSESALHESETRYRELADSIADIFFALDNQLKITYWNKAIAQLTGMPADKALGKSLRAIFPGIQATQIETVYFKVKKGQQPYTFIQPFWLKEKPAYFEINVYPSRDGVSIFAKNVTYQKQMEEALKKSWDYLQNLNNSLGDAIFTVNLPEQTIEYVNKAVEHIFGYTIEECIGKSTHVFFPNKLSYVAFARNLQTAVTGQQKILRTEQVLRRKNGAHFTAEITTTFLNETGDRARVISIVRDVTDRKQMEIALEQERASLAQKVEERTEELQRMNAELARASRLKDEFLANISHDLRTPLNAILGYAKILKKSCDLSPMHYEGLNTIQSSGEQLLQLITDILDLARIESGYLELRPVDVPLSEFLRYLVNIMQMRSEQKGIVFVYDPSPNLPSVIRADKKRLHEILINLLDNAVKFTDQGTVTLRVSCSEPVSPTQTNSDPPLTHLRFEIQDTGPGIPEAFIEEIFLPFQRLNWRHHTTDGTGLGLAISRQFVKMMGGELSVCSTVGEGSVFWFEISVPFSSNVFSEIDGQKLEIVGYHGKRKTLLLVDDVEANRAVLRNILLPIGFEILEAENGKQCLELTVQKHPDLIFLDLRMPDMDGFDVVRHVRSTEGIDETLVIAISASILEETQKKSLEAGCNAFLAKPLEEEMLLEALQTHLQLQWMYQKIPPRHPSQDFQHDQILAVRLPAGERALLQKFARCGNVSRILKYLDMLESQGAEYLPFVETLRKLTKNFHMKSILELLDQMEEHHGV